MTDLTPNPSASAESAFPRLDHDIVIVTRNRPEALRLSLPLLVGQSRPAVRLVIVDASDDHDAVRRTVDETTRGAPFEVIVLRSAAGMTRQRRVGLEAVRSPVVLYPDDDSLFFPNTSDAMLRVYERDVEGAVGGVCARPYYFSPLAPTGGQSGDADIRLWDRIKNRIAWRWPALTSKIAPDPFAVHGRAMIASMRLPEWLPAANAIPVNWMTGFRMSFRTDVIREVGFEEAFSNYGGFEDASVSFRVFDRGKLLVAALDADIFHHRFPSRRSHGVGMGMRQVLNKAFIICRHSPPGSEARRALRPFANLKIAQYLAAAHTRFGRERILGAWRARGKIDLLDRCPPESLLETYRAARADCLRGYADV